MAIPAEALDLIKEFERCMRLIAGGRYAPYLCPANVPTVGWGTTRYPTGQRVTMKDAPIEKAQADGFLNHEVADNERAFDRFTTRTVPPLSRGAVVSFIYNCGSGHYQASGLRRAINEGRWSDTPREFAKWRMGGGVVLAGLIRRRREEADLFMKGIRGKASPAPTSTPAPAPAPQQFGYQKGWVGRLLKKLPGW